MTGSQAKALLVVNSVIICVYAITAWASGQSPLALAIAVVAGMIAQIASVRAPRRTPRAEASSQQTHHPS